ncbi:MAG TPA: phosphate-starvation-inducible PsiE family protein [Terriglobales bacterium]|nr:phosphate-starvation-inducible PsiE family protein [Terriglobales bacterium]
MVEERYRYHFDGCVRKAELAIYGFLAVLLTVTAVAALADGGLSLWSGIRTMSISAKAFEVLDRLLFVLMVVEILHTVSISIRSHILVTEPFLVVGLIASIRRILVITLEASTLAKGGAWNGPSESIFRASMIELGLLGLLILILVFSITLLRRSTPTPEALETQISEPLAESFSARFQARSTPRHSPAL